jgi:hypothetical protein
MEGAQVQTLDEFDKRMEELDVDVMTPNDFIRERRRLEQRFVETYRIAAALINPLIRSGEIQDGELVEEWIRLMSLEPYVFPHGSRRRPPDEKPEEPEQKSRESGSFLSGASHPGCRAAYTPVSGYG